MSHQKNFFLAILFVSTNLVCHVTLAETYRCEGGIYTDKPNQYKSCVSISSHQPFNSSSTKSGKNDYKQQRKAIISKEYQDICSKGSDELAYLLEKAKLQLYPYKDGIEDLKSRHYNDSYVGVSDKMSARFYYLLDKNLTFNESKADLNSYCLNLLH